MLGALMCSLVILGMLAGRQMRETFTPEPFWRDPRLGFRMIRWAIVAQLGASIWELGMLGTYWPLHQ